MKEQMFIDEFDLEISENMYPVIQARRDELLKHIKNKFSDKKGIVLVSGAFLQSSEPFVQDSAFWYFTGISEPGCVLVLSLEDDRAILFVPNFSDKKQEWDTQEITKNSEAENFLLDEIRVLGKEMLDINISPRAKHDVFEGLITYLKQHVSSGGFLFSLFSDANMSPVSAFFLDRIIHEAEIPQAQCIDILPIVTEMRMKKDEQEIARLYNAIDVTTTAFEAAMSTIAENITESEVQAAAEFVITANGCKRSFPSIVAAGKNATILHYHDNKDLMRFGDLVLIDMGARYDYYCADLSRTIPVSGKFSKRQKELYEIVLEVQAHIAQMAKPGVFLNNKKFPEQSLHHQAVALFKTYKLDQFFIHGIGHHLGLDVHDGADYSKPLEVGNVITIEPGLYIKEEHIGIRIEDNYMITETGAVCLSENLPKMVADIERAMQSQSSSFDDDLFLNSSVISRNTN